MCGPPPPKYKVEVESRFSREASGSASTLVWGRGAGELKTKTVVKFLAELAEADSRRRGTTEPRGMWIPVNFSYLWTPIRCTASLQTFFQSCASSVWSFSKSSAICVDVCKNNIRWEGTRPPALSQGTLGLSLILSGQDHLQEAPGHPATRQANETPSNPPHHPGPPTHPGPHPPIHPTPSISTWVTRLSEGDGSKV